MKRYFQNDEVNCSTRQLTLFVVCSLSSQAFRKAVEDFAEKKEHEISDACFVFIMSHGKPCEDTGEDGIVCYDGHCIPISWVESQFNNANATRLIGKPKVLLFHCCRGEKNDTGVRMQHTLQRSQSRKDSAEDDGHEKDGLNKYDAWAALAAGDRRTVPTVTDMLVLYSTVPGESCRERRGGAANHLRSFFIQGMVAYRDRLEGSWYIQILCRAIREHAHEMPLRDILDEVGDATLQQLGYES